MNNLNYTYYLELLENFSNSYLVMRNFEEYPDLSCKDLDILCGYKVKAKIIEKFEEAATVNNHMLFFKKHTFSTTTGLAILF